MGIKTDNSGKAVGKRPLKDGAEPIEEAAP
jgi:hypothetical protein